MFTRSLLDAIFHCICYDRTLIRIKDDHCSYRPNMGTSLGVLQFCLVFRDSTQHPGRSRLGLHSATQGVNIDSAAHPDITIPFLLLGWNRHQVEVEPGPFLYYLRRLYIPTVKFRKPFNNLSTCKHPLH